MAGTERLKSWFFKKVNGIRDNGTNGGIRFFKGDEPTQSTFEDLLETTYTKLEDSATASDIINGTIKKVVQANNLPILLEGENTSTVGLDNGLEIVEEAPITGRPSKRFTIRLKQSWIDVLESLTSSGSTYDGPDVNNVTLGNLQSGTSGLQGKTSVEILKLALNQIIIPTIGISSFSLKEKGTSFTPTITATITPNNGTITGRRIKRNSTLINSPAGNSISFADSARTVNVVYSIEADYTTTAGSSIAINSTGLNFEAPMFNGCGVVGLTQSQIKLLSKSIQSKSTKNITYSVLNNQVFYFAYPNSWGNVTSIKDENGFESLTDFTLRNETWTLADASNEDYKILEYKTIQTTPRSTFFIFTIP